jgi:hypothetical protein
MYLWVDDPHLRSVHCMKARCVCDILNLLCWYPRSEPPLCALGIAPTGWLIRHVESLTAKAGTHPPAAICMLTLHLFINPT